MRPLIIGPDETEALRRLREYAEAHPIPLLRMHRIRSGEEVMPSAYDRRHFVEVPHGFGVVLTVEEHPSGWTHHVSVCVAEPGRVPRLGAIAAVLEAMGLLPESRAVPAGGDRLYRTPAAPGLGESINLLLPIEAAARGSGNVAAPGSGRPI